MSDPEQAIADHDFLAQLQTSLATDDNRCTSHPMFVVRTKEVDEHVTDCSDCDYWRGDDYESLPKEVSDALEAAYEAGDPLVHIDGTTYIVEDCYRLATEESWSIVQAFFTKKGADDYIECNGHNLREPHAYVESGYRNQEWINLRRLLPELINAWKTVKGYNDV